MAETLRNRNIAAVITKNIIVPGCLHHLEVKEGERRPIIAYIIFEKPTTGIDEARIETEAMKYVGIRCHGFA